MLEEAVIPVIEIDDVDRTRAEDLDENRELPTPELLTVSSFFSV